MEQGEAALKFFARLGPAERDFLAKMDDELTSEEVEQVMRSISRKIIACRMRVTEERHFKKHPPPPVGEPLTEVDIEKIVNAALTSEHSRN